MTYLIIYLIYLLNTILNTLMNQALSTHALSQIDECSTPQEGITSYAYYKILYQENVKLKKQKEFLKTLEQYLKDTNNDIIDPINYLYTLYYKSNWEQNLSYKEIYEKTKNISTFQSVEGIRKMYQNHLMWPAITEVSNRTREKKSKIQVPQNITQQEQTIKNNTNIFKKRLEFILTKQEPQLNKWVKFSKEKFDEISWKMKQITYLISTSLHITEENATQIIPPLRSNGLGKVILARCMQSIIQPLCDTHNIPLEITQSNIDYLSDYTYQQYVALEKQPEVQSVILEDLPEYQSVFIYTFSTWYPIFRAGTGKFSKILESRLILLKKQLSKIYTLPVDPIEYLHFLYYRQDYSPKKISELLAERWIEWSWPSLYKTFHRYLNWPKKSKKIKETRGTKDDTTINLKQQRILDAWQSFSDTVKQLMQLT